MFPSTNTHDTSTELGTEGTVGTKHTQVHPHGAEGLVGEGKHESHNCRDKHTVRQWWGGKASLRKWQLNWQSLHKRGTVGSSIWGPERRQMWQLPKRRVVMWSCGESSALKNWCFWTVVLEKTPESPLDCKEIQPVHSKGDQSWVFFGRNDAKAETPVLWPPHAKSWLIGKDSDAGRIGGKRRRGWQRMW